MTTQTNVIPLSHLKVLDLSAMLGNFPCAVDANRVEMASLLFEEIQILLNHGKWSYLKVVGYHPVHDDWFHLFTWRGTRVSSAISRAGDENRSFNGGFTNFSVIPVA